MSRSREELSAAYGRARRFLHWNADRYCFNLEIDHQWLGDTDSFVYTRRSKEGTEYVVVDATTGDKRSVSSREEALNRRAAGTRELALTLTVRGHDLWLGDRRLTTDGAEHYAYGKIAGSSAGFRSFIHAEPTNTPVALWSPDKTRFVTYRLDERNVRDLHLLESAPSAGVCPISHRYKYAFPGDDEKPRAELMVFNALTGECVRMKTDSLPVTMLDPIQDDRVWWSHDGLSVYAIPREEGQKRVQLLKMDAATGDTEVLIEERADTYVEIAGYAWNRAVRTLRDGRIIWYSERGDWGHLYLYDARGGLIRQLTSGEWKVMDVVRVDDDAGFIYFTAVGREKGEDPYFRHLYVVDLQGSEPRLLAPEHADHDIRIASSPIIQQLIPGMLGPDRASFSPSGRYFLDTFSRPDQAPITVLRTREGNLVCEIERADISALEEAGGLAMPEPFIVLAADGVTQIYGTLHRPSDFDATKSYPVIDVIYPGPQMLGTGKSFKSAVFGFYDATGTQAIAELGFIVVTIDGRGTPFRAKSFHDVTYGKMQRAGHLEDHIAGIRQLATRYPYMDRDRVGITGHSGGGFASTRAVLEYPDFYKVAVSIAGNHDQRGYLLVWGPTYQGPDGDFLAAANAPLVGNLRGKLLLMHGELDDNVHPALTMQLVKALIEANRDFDFLLLPGEDHMLTRGSAAYVHRRTWDYFLRHLRGEEPPG